MDWMIKNGQWVNLSRIKRIARFYLAAEKPLNRSLITHEVYLLFLRHLKSGSKLMENAGNSAGALEDKSINNVVDTYKKIFKTAYRKRTAVQPRLQNPCLLQLHLRAIFGINARAELLLYLFLQKQGNSNSIAREIGFDQKIVYRLLESWAETGLVMKTEGKYYQLSPTSSIKAVLPASVPPRYTNWISGFLTLSKILEALEIEPFSADTYALSSFFRDILPNAKTIARSVDLSFSDDRLYQGADYFQSFASEMLEIMEKL
jgi:hypothetical protein